MEQLSNLSEIKKSLPGDVLQQLRNVNIFNMCAKEHFPDENSCIAFAQGFGLIASYEAKILHCGTGFCQVAMDRNYKVGFRFICRNKKSHHKERCLKVISPLDNTFFVQSRMTIHNIFKLVMCFVSKLTAKQVEHQLSFSHPGVLEWYLSFREVCKVILANEYQTMIHRVGETVVNETNLFLWKYGLGKKRIWDVDVDSSEDDANSKNDERNDSYKAEAEYRRRFFNNMDMEPLPLDDQFLIFLHHIKLVFPGPGKVGLMYPIIDNADNDISHEINSSTTEALLSNSSVDTNDVNSQEVNTSMTMGAMPKFVSYGTILEPSSKRKKKNISPANEVKGQEVNTSRSMEAVSNNSSECTNEVNSQEVNNSMSRETPSNFLTVGANGELTSKRKRKVISPANEVNSQDVNTPLSMETVSNNSSECANEANGQEVNTSMSMETLSNYLSECANEANSQEVDTSMSVDVLSSFLCVGANVELSSNKKKISLLFHL